MSFHSSLTAALVWPADLVTAGIVATAAQVYTGRRPRQPTDSRGEVWLERLADPPTEGGGFQHVRRHAYRVHVREVGLAGSDKAGAAQLTAAEAKAQTIKERYDAAVPFTSTFSGMLPAEAVEDSVDVDPGDPGNEADIQAVKVIDVAVLVTFNVKE